MEATCVMLDLSDPLTAVLRCSGWIQSHTIEALENALAKTAKNGAIKAVVFDLAEVDYINSAGMAVILKASKDLKERGGTVSVVNLKPNLKRLFDIIGLTGQTTCA